MPDAGTASVGDTPQPASAHPPTEQKPIAQETPFQPRPGQARPNAKGHCPGRKQVIINGACWVELRTTDAEECVESGHDFLAGKCYVPAQVTRRPALPTSSPADAR
jgi:hypothetical protein